MARFLPNVLSPINAYFCDGIQETDDEEERLGLGPDGGTVGRGRRGAAQAGLMSYTSAGVDLVYDDVRDLTWMRDANLFKTQSDADNTVVTQIITAVPTVTSGNGTHNLAAADFNTGNGRMNWYGAMAWAQWLGDIGYAGADDWRLFVADPSCGFSYNCTNNELGSLFYGPGGLSAYDSILADPPGILDDYFSNMQSSAYWSGTEYAPVPNYAWYFYTGVGTQVSYDKDTQYYGWAVRPGQVAAAPLPGTALLMALRFAALPCHCCVAGGGDFGDWVIFS